MASRITSFPEALQGPPQLVKPSTQVSINIDKFATLFSPATPPASPTLEPIDAVSGPSRMPYPRPRSYNHDRRDISGSDPDSGLFVSVQATDDPLSSFDSALPPPTEASSSSRNDPDHNRKSSSLRFFGKFAQEAKEAAERNKRGVLDELLLHEDDPLYWLKEQDHESALKPDDTPWPPLQPSEGESESSISAYSRESLDADSDTSRSLMDLDQDFFTVKPGYNPASSPPNNTHTPISVSPQSPSRSPTQLARATLAPPVASTSTASSTPLSEISDPLSDNGMHEEHPTARRSTSYQTLSSRWMSSLLKSHPSNPNNTGHSGPASLETLFNSETPSAERRKHRSRSNDAHPHTVRHAHTLASTSAVHISHGTPFGHHPRNSPFAPHFYTPPSGAPGFAGESYDWDKGFSTDLRLEMERESEQDNGGEAERGRQGQEMIDVRRNGSGSGSGGGSGSRRENGPGRGREGGRKEFAESVPVVGVGQFMDKKSGNVQLDGRKAITTAVLTVELANMIRPHLPALARLPRKWSLLYSLDQHGISLNTLYARCEFPPPRLETPSPRGALLVVKDAGDALFGVWMGEEGVRPSRGKGYYGSGECFMWKYVDTKFEVFSWTGRNDYVALCEPEYISFGGGDGQYGLYLDESLLDGSTARCLTFENDPLCTPGPMTGGTVKFECVGLEVWSIGP